jgi:hypothetical protein
LWFASYWEPNGRIGHCCSENAIWTKWTGRMKLCPLSEQRAVTVWRQQRNKWRDWQLKSLRVTPESGLTSAVAHSSYLRLS